MANITSAQSGLWSATSTWSGGVVPQNGDTVTIQAGHEVIFDVDQSGWANGLAGLTINGTLKFKVNSNTCLKMAGNITGTGALYVGNSDSDPIQSSYTAKILLNGAYTVNVTTMRFYGEIREHYDTIAQNASAGQPNIVLKNGMTLRANDVIGIGRNVAGQYAELYTVQSYDSGTKTVTLTANLNYNRVIGDTVILITRNIVCENIHASSKSYFTSTSNGIAKGVLFKGFNPAPIYSTNNWLFDFSAGQNNTFGGICYSGSGHVLNNPIGQNNTSGGICYWGSGHKIYNATSSDNPKYYYPQTLKIYNDTKTTNYISGYTDVSRTEDQVIEAFNLNNIHNNYGAWLRGGKIETDFSAYIAGFNRSLKFIHENGNFRIFRDFEMYLPANVDYEFSVWVKKSYTGSSTLPSFQLIDACDPNTDPLYNGTPIKEATMTDVANQWQRLTIRYKPTTDKIIKLRVVAKNSSGYTWFITQGIEELLLNKTSPFIPPHQPSYFVRP